MALQVVFQQVCIVLDYKSLLQIKWLFQLFRKNMNCSKCKWRKAGICPNCYHSSSQAKLKQIRLLEESVASLQATIQSQLDNQLVLRPSEQNTLNKTSQYGTIKGQLNKKIQKSIVLQQKMKILGKIKRQIEHKENLIKETKSRICHKAKILQILEKGNHIVSEVNKQAREGVQELQKSKRHCKLFQPAKQLQAGLKYLKDEIILPFMQTYEYSVRLQGGNLFEIKKTQQLDFFNCNMEIDLEKSCYELKPMEEVHVKKKVSEKTLQLLHNNLIVLQLLTETLNLWVPYPLTLDKNRNSLRITHTLQDLEIGGIRLIDFGNTSKLTQNIKQFFESAIKSNPSKEEFQKSETNTEATYNREKIGLNKKFINYLQGDLEFLAAKHGLVIRPLVFLTKELVERIFANFVFNTMLKGKNHFYYGRIFDSCLKELQSGSLIECVEGMKNRFSSQLKQKDSFFGHPIQEEQEAIESVPSLKEIPSLIEKKATSTQGLQMSVYEQVPHGLSVQKSSDNEQFEYLH